MQRMGRQVCGSDMRIWNVTMPRYEILKSLKILAEQPLLDLNLSVQDVDLRWTVGQQPRRQEAI